MDVSARKQAASAAGVSQERIMAPLNNRQAKTKGVFYLAPPSILSLHGETLKQQVPHRARRPGSDLT